MGNNGSKSYSETNLGAFLESAHNDIVRNDEIDLVEAYHSTNPGLCERQSQKLLDGAWCKNDWRAAGYHVTYAHCETIVCNSIKDKRLSLANLQAKSKHHFERCWFMKGTRYNQN